MHWLIANRVIKGNITDYTHEKTCSEILALLDSGTAPVHIILDDSALTKTSLLPLNLLSTANIARHPNLGRIVCIGPEDHQAPFIDRVIVRAYRVNLNRVSTFQEAWATLLSKDDTLKTSFDENTLAQM